MGRRHPVGTGRDTSVKAHATGWDLGLVVSDGVECLRVWWLGDHIADCHTVAEILRVVPFKVLRVLVDEDASDINPTEGPTSGL